MFLLNKNQIRQNILHIRSKLPEEQKLELENIIAQRFKEFIKAFLSKQDNIIAGYYPVGSELNILQTLEKLPAKILLPVIGSSSKLLQFYFWSPLDKLCSSPYAPNILEPLVKTKEEIPGIIIAPLIACDLRGNRLGSGKAMYDVTVAHLRKQNSKLVYIGVCYDFQLIDELPAEEHDQKLDFILTDKRLEIIRP